ncbi:hypothetical protein BJY16_005053 [Actinoplanes octamycinicus]|uniref:Uncharacterized protein n=1 Tax=Actinoplanes octamycinicus TaxID=135948 RepID=A0A7W7H0B4_9ACTN|nr:hypothetical protein [Actinoplanes octamycinicus]MBB4741594.1 hypothetical protein [Actinoplanes octamycinicus]GIE57146.1 hypothetical protein Aoc01nite_25480 [Actinoplanes octamycinicus]
MNETITGTLRRAAGTRGRRILLGVTAGIGLLAAVALPGALPSGQVTFAELSEQVQLLISVPLPFVGVLLAHDLRRTPGARVLPTLAGAAVIAVVAGLLGVLFSVAALAASGSGAPDPWAHAGRIAVAGVLAQVLAQSVGTGLGLLIARPVWGCLATIVLPLGTYTVLAPLAAARPWLTPYGAAQELFAGGGWASWAAAALLWGALLNVIGAARLQPQLTPRP